MKKIIIYLAVIVLVVWGVIALGKRPAPQPARNTSQLQQETLPLETGQQISYQGKEGVDALTLLRENNKVETQDFGGQPMVTSINGLNADSQSFWAFYINGEMAETGANQYKTKDSDIIEWRLQAIQ